MNLKSLEYFVEVAKDLNMTSAAQRLYISQQALSSQMQKLENYYGVTLFERQPKLQLTYAGMQLLEGANKILQESTDIVNSLSEISRTHAGVLRIGIPSYRAAECFPIVLPEFTRRWPNVSIHLAEAPSAEMLEMLRNGALDVAVISLASTETPGLDYRLEFTFLLDDHTYLICSDELLHRYLGRQFERVKKCAVQGTDLRDFSELPFMLHKPPMHLRRIADECFHNAAFKPKVFIESSNTELIVSLYPCHLGAFFCRRSRVHSLVQRFEGCNAFPVKQENTPNQTSIYLVRRKSARPPLHVLDFETLMQKAWKKIAEY